MVLVAGVWVVAPDMFVHNQRKHMAMSWTEFVVVVVVSNRIDIILENCDAYKVRLDSSIVMDTYIDSLITWCDFWIGWCVSIDWIRIRLSQIGNLEWNIWIICIAHIFEPSFCRTF